MKSRKFLNIASILLAAGMLPSLASAQDINDPGVLSEENALQMMGAESDESVQMAAERGLAIQAEQAMRPAMRSTKGGILSGKRLSLSPGHGIKRESSVWSWQRGFTYQVKEDITTYEWMHDFVRPMLERAGAETLMMRASGYAESSQVITESTKTGTWNNGTANSSSINYMSCKVDANETATATWTFRVEKDGYYPIHARYYTGTNRAKDARFTVNHARGASIVNKDQSEMRIDKSSLSSSSVTQATAVTSSNTWHYLGKFPFKAGVDYTVVLSNQGSDTNKYVIADAVQIGEGAGTIKLSGKTSGQYKWQESALAWLEYIGMPGWITSGGDVSGRSLYSLYEGVDAQFSLHTNSASGSSRGTTTWVWFPQSTSNNQQWIGESQWNKTEGVDWSPTTGSDYAKEMLPPGTYQFAKHVHNRFGDYVKHYWDSSWTISSNLNGCNFGELRPARNAWYYNKSSSKAIAVPSTIMEAAFHDNTKDAKVIREHKFRFYGARGILAGIIQYFAGDDAMIPPLPPHNLTVVGDGDHLSVSWEPTKDEVITNSDATSYRVYTSDDGVLFDVDPLMTVTDTSVEIPVSRGKTMYVRVTAVNAAGESLDSIVGAGRLANLNQKHILYVDGIDREVKCAYDANNNRDYARVYAPAIEALNANYGIDTIDDEAIVDHLKKHSYDLVIWSTSETSIDSDVLNNGQRKIVRQLRTAGTPIILSGSEFGYALASTYNSDKTFLADVFDAKYTSDDAYPEDNYILNSTGAKDTNYMNPTPQVIASSNVISRNFEFSECIANGGSVAKSARDAECIEFPDVYEPVNNASTLLKYGTGTGAAILSADGKAILAGFPLESVNDPDTRIELISKLMATVLGETAGAEFVPDDEVCDNGTDDDGNGKADCDDDACKDSDFCKAPGVAEICDNHIDDDKDGRLDCGDPDCFEDPACTVMTEICDNNIDDDKDGAADCEDEDCSNDSKCQIPDTETDTTRDEICDNNVDDDGDGKTDCADDDCKDYVDCKAQTEEPGEDPGEDPVNPPDDDPADDPGNSEAKHASSDDCSISAAKPELPAGFAMLAALFGLGLARLRRKRS